MGTWGMHSPLWGFKFFEIHTVFGKNLAKSYVGNPREILDAPLLSFSFPGIPSKGITIAQNSLIDIPG